MIELPKLVLASASPRRAEILSFVGWEFERRPADVDESILPDEKPEDYVRRLAREKALAVAGAYENAIILGADTIVVIDDQIIGKPRNLEDARRMLRLLSGNWHEVLTGVALVLSESTALPEESDKAESGFSDFGMTDEERADPKTKIPNLKSLVGLQRTLVKFAELSDEEIGFLIEKGEPLDKAGGYAVQAQAALFIEKIEGDYWNVVGLPVNLVYNLVKKF